VPLHDSRLPETKQKGLCQEGQNYLEFGQFELLAFVFFLKLKYYVQIKKKILITS